MTQQRPKPGLVSSSVDKLKQRLLSMVYYLTAEQSVLQLNAGGWQQSSDFSRLPVLLLSRACYQEKRQSFAIRSASELRKVLKQSEQGKLSFHFISGLDQGQRKVLTISPYPEFWSICQKASLVLPASLVLANTAEAGLHYIESPDKPLFLLKHPSGEWQSALATPVMKQADSALLLLGGHPQTPCYSWSQTQLTALLRQGLPKLSPQDWFAGWNGLQSTQKKLPWPLLISSTLVLSFCYLLVGSAYLELTSLYRQYKLEQGGGQMSQLLQERQQLQQQQQLISVLKQQLHQPANTQLIWELVSALQLNGVEVVRLQWAGQELQLIAEADDATKALQIILDQPFVLSAQFSSPVRKVQKKEGFNATIALDSKAITAEEQKQAEPHQANTEVEADHD
jgi:hypothetical protein